MKKMNRLKGISLSLAALCAFGVYAAEENWEAPRTPFGHPDMQGIWTNATQTPLQRPRELGTKRAFTLAESRAQEQQWLDYIEQRSQPSDPDRPPPEDGNTDLGYDNFWVDMGTSVIRIGDELRTSIIIEPENGRIPLKEGVNSFGRTRIGQDGQRLGPYDGPEARPLGERCIMSFGSSGGPPMLPVMYNNNYQIVQTQDYVVILVEMVHDARIVRLDDTHMEGQHKWLGDSVGYYEGNSLIVETTHFNPGQSFAGSTPDAVIRERFTLVADDKIEYRFTVEDEAVYTEPFTGEIAMYRRPAGEKMYEYACHEGNYALPGILAGARQAEMNASDN
ncbi:MAG: hypothetical protein RQ757_13630 [Pseudomonadales bacterium]|nr:hypothetical protein [Pseudomonadales bacterium]